MRKWLLRIVFPVVAVICSLMFAIGPATPARAATTATVVITATGQYVAITNSQTTWALGTVGAGATSTWGTSNSYSTLSNTGNVAVSVFLTGANLIGVSDTWVLATAPGTLTYELQDNMATVGTFSQAITGAGVTAKTGVAAAAAVPWSMVFLGPSSLTGYNGTALTATITISASQ
jgi:hypothetical protein